MVQPDNRYNPRNHRTSPSGFHIWDEDCPRCLGTGELPPVGRSTRMRKCVPCDGIGIVIKSDDPQTLM